MLTAEYFADSTALQSYTVCHNEHFTKSCSDERCQDDASDQKKTIDRVVDGFEYRGCPELDFLLDPGCLTMLTFQVIQLSSSYAT